MEGQDPALPISVRRRDRGLRVIPLPPPSRKCQNPSSSRSIADGGRKKNEVGGGTLPDAGRTGAVQSIEYSRYLRGW